jgi:hypothetical protein
MQSLRQRLPEFSHDALNGALHVLDQADNKMRAHRSGGTLRELIGHVLGVMAPHLQLHRFTSKLFVALLGFRRNRAQQVVVLSVMGMLLS